MSISVNESLKLFHVEHIQ